MNDLLKNIEDVAEKIKAKAELEPALLVELQSLLSQLVLSIQINQLMMKLQDAVGKSKPMSVDGERDSKEPAAEKVSHSEALDELEKIATTRKTEAGSREFLLHRSTEDHEHGAATTKEANRYENKAETSWFPEYMTGQNQKDGANPVVTCWVPEGQVASIPNPYPNTGLWKELGKNPNAARYEVLVKPGTYEITQEYTGS